MNKCLLVLTALLLNALVFSTTNGQSVDSLHANATTFIMKGDAQNALMILNRAEQQYPNNLETTKLIAFTYYNQRDFAAALPYAKKIALSPGADFQQVQMAGLVYKAIAMYKEADKLYTEAIARFPGNGTLFSEFGELLYLNKEDKRAVEIWEKGIAADPNISGNYYHASKYYSASGNLLWALLYGETFVNLESFTERTAEVKSQILKDYKRLFQAPLMDAKKKYSPFEVAVLKTLNHYSNFTMNGVTAASLHNIRSKFIEDWNKQYDSTYPYRLFVRYNEHLREKTFEAYNHWLLSDDPSTLRQWALANKESFNNFLTLQNNRIFKLPKGQYYK